jgi:succinate dehydrogenase / fumarate reductase cytochrome b subunit
MIRLVRLFSTSIGQKLLVALSGAALLGFLLGHMLGNLAVFQGPDALNGYAAWLQGHPLVWFIRVGLLGVFGFHVLVTIRLARANRRAGSTASRRAVAHHVGLTSRFMALTGMLVIAFVVFHLLHFTFGAVQPENFQLGDSLGRHDVYSMVVGGFQNPFVAGTYVLAILLVGVHLLHGVASLFQTLGINHESYNVLIRYGSQFLVAVVVIGFCSIPILIFTGLYP